MGTSIQENPRLSKKKRITKELKFSLKSLARQARLQFLKGFQGREGFGRAVPFDIKNSRSRLNILQSFMMA
jgi:hypothetical protein